MPPESWIDRVAKRLGEALAWVFALSVVIVVYEVVARYAFNAPTIWAHESTIALTAIGFIFGGAYTFQRREHIRITAVYFACGPRVRRFFDVIAALVAIFYLGVLVYAGTLVAEKSWKTMETSGSAWNQPIPVLLKTALVLGAVLMLLQAVALLARVLRGHEPDHQG